AACAIAVVGAVVGALHARCCQPASDNTDVRDSLAVRHRRLTVHHPNGRWGPAVRRIVRGTVLRVQQGHRRDSMEIRRSTRSELLVQALDVKSGDVNWSRQLEGRINTPPSPINGHVFVGTGKNVMYRLALSTGAIERQIELPGTAYGSPTPIGDRIVVPVFKN